MTKRAANKPTATPNKKKTAAKPVSSAATSQTSIHTPAVEETAREARTRRRQNRQREMLDRPARYANRLQQVSGRLSFSSNAAAKQARGFIEQAREKLLAAADILKTLPASAVPARRTDIQLAPGVTVVFTKKGKDWAVRLLGLPLTEVVESTWVVLNASAQHVRIQSVTRPDVALSPAARLVSILGVAEADEDADVEAGTEDSTPPPNGAAHYTREEAQEDTGL